MNQLIKDLSIINIDTIISYARIKGHDIFEDNGDYNLNIWAIRSENSKAGRFDDVELVFWKHEGEWNMQVYTCTTDPGKHYLLNPLSKYGTAIVKPGQYHGVFRLGYHQGKLDHPALVQHRPITVIRDFNKDTILDYDYEGEATKFVTYKGNNIITKYKIGNDVIHTEETGLFGINNHRASQNIISKIVGRYSAGCIVQNNPNKYYGEFIPTIQKAKSIWGNSFTFTLVTERDIKRLIYED